MTRDERRERDEQAAQDRVALLFGLTPPEPLPQPDIVGWMQRSPDTMLGVNHVCIGCSPKRPGKGHWELVTRDRAAATRRCTRCDVILEQVVV